MLVVMNSKTAFSCSGQKFACIGRPLKFDLNASTNQHDKQHQHALYFKFNSGLTECLLQEITNTISLLTVSEFYVNKHDVSSNVLFYYMHTFDQHNTHT